MEKYEGKIVACGEHNYAWDSDFYIVVWDEEERTFKEIITGSTGCANHTYYDKADAPEELISRYYRWKYVTERWNKRCDLIRLYCEGGLFYGDVERLLKAYPDRYPTRYALYACLKLLRTKKFRSAFRESLQKQLTAWIEGASKYERPFSERQLDFLY